MEIIIKIRYFSCKVYQIKNQELILFFLIDNLKDLNITMYHKIILYLHCNTYLFQEIKYKFVQHNFVCKILFLRYCKLFFNLFAAFFYTSNKYSLLKILIRITLWVVHSTQWINTNCVLALWSEFTIHSRLSNSRNA